MVMVIILEQQTRNKRYYKRLEYEKMILEKLNFDIPPKNAIESDLIQVYRLVVDAKNIHPDDFIPKAFKQPFNPRREYTPSECGISIFSDLYSIKKNLLAYRGNQRQIAIGNLYKRWGKHSGFNKNAHADFWKYIEVDYQELANEFQSI